ncbi:MAG TPA: MFS transporter [Solirubrobacteraceae bacterium]|nr:MFS transporter [Solirubrobacteraceae bacterium]
MSSVTTVRESVRAVLANKGLRLLVASTGATSVGKWGFGIALAVYAYRTGGATLVGVVLLLQAFPSVAAAPILAWLGDRHSRKRVLFVTNAARTVMLAGAAAAMWAHAPPAIVFGLAVLYSIVSTANQPARAALIPALSRVPSEASGANAVMSSLDNAGFLVGAGLGGVLVAATSTQAVVAACALAYLLSLWMIGALPHDARPSSRRVKLGLAHEIATGFRTVSGQPQLRLLVLLLAGLSVTGGLANVLVVVTAISLLHVGAAGVGYLSAAYGAGGVLAGVAAIALLERSIPVAAVLVGACALCLPLVIVGIVPLPATALIAWAAIGLGYALVKGTALTLLQRLTEDRVLSRVLGVLETTFVAGIGIGAIVAPALVSALGTKGALIASGVFLPLIALMSGRSLRNLEAGAPVPSQNFQLLRANPIFAPMPIGTTESLTRALRDITVPAGQVVIRQGDPGDLWFLIAEGEVDVAKDGVVQARLGTGEGFGEIALLRDVPRTATVRAVAPTRLLALDRDRFLSAVTGLRESHEAAQEIATNYLASAGSSPTEYGC